MKKQKRIRCSDERFLEAIFSSNTYYEIAEKTGQKLATVIARYNKIKNILAEKNVEIPQIQKSPKNLQNIENMIKIVKRLKTYHFES